MKKFLIVKINGIGDIIMALTMIPCIKDRYDDAHITWIASSAAENILKASGVDEVIKINEKNILYGNFTEKLRELFKVWKAIAFRKFDEVVIPYRDKRYLLFTIFSRKHNLFAFWRFKDRLFPIPERNFYNEYRRIITKNDCESYDFKPFYIKGEVPFIDFKYIVLAPGGEKEKSNNLRLRRWPVERYANLSEELMSKGYKVVLTGGKNDRWVLPYFDKKRIIDFIGKTDIQESIQLYSTALCVVTHDSGVLHMAGKGNATIIGLFGPTSPNVFMPKVQKSSIIWKNDLLPCCPCYDGRTFADCNNNTCMEKILVKDVIDAIEKILEGSF